MTIGSRKRFTFKEVWPAYILPLLFFLLTFIWKVNEPLSYYYLFCEIIIVLLLFGVLYSLLVSRFKMKSLEKETEKHRQKIVNSSHDLIYTIGLDGLISSANPACKVLLGYYPDEMLGQPFEKYLYTGDRERVKKIIENAQDERSIEFEARFIDRDNNIKWISWNVSISKTFQMIDVVGRDITEKKKSDELILMKNYQLDLARILTDQENIRNEEAFQEESMLLRSQLQSISGYLEVVINDADNLDPDLKEFLELSLDSTRKMLDSSENVIEMKYSKISDVTFRIKKFSVNEVEQILINNSPSFFAGAESRFSSDFSMTKNISILGDSQKLSDSLRIIIDECNKTQKGCKYTLKSSVDEKSNEVVLKLSGSEFKRIPDKFLRRGLEYGDVIENYSFTGDEFPIFLAKSYINVMKGSVEIKNDEADNLHINIKLPIEK